ncbi:hypothetical protein OXX59_003825 [Metschnikowia pulcherrima]
MMNKVSNLEAALDNYLKLMTKNEQVVHLLARDSIVENILAKLTVYSKAPAAKLSLLKILHQIVAYITQHHTVKRSMLLDTVRSTMASIVTLDPSVLAKDLASRISSAILSNCR